jgi:hypothetical protein
MRRGLRSRAAELAHSRRSMELAVDEKDLRRLLGALNEVDLNL